MPDHSERTTPGIAACTSSWGQQYIDHYAGDDDKCRRCGTLTAADRYLHGAYHPNGHCPNGICAEPIAADRFTRDTPTSTALRSKGTA